MKKILAMILAAAMVLAVCSAWAETAEKPVFATIGEASVASEYPVMGGDEEHYAVALEKDGKFYRVVAEIDREKVQELDDAITAAFAARDAYFLSLEPAYVEEFTVEPIPQAELDALVGKTVAELEAAGFECNTYGPEEEDRIIFRMAYGVYEYAFEADADQDGFAAAQEADGIGEIRVRSAAFAGLSGYASELRFHADGTVDEPEDLFGEFNGLMEMVSEAIAAAKEGGEVDYEALTEKLIEAMPDKAEDIRGMVQLFMMTSGLGGE